MPTALTYDLSRLLRDSKFLNSWNRNRPFTDTSDSTELEKYEKALISRPAYYRLTDGQIMALIEEFMAFSV